MTKIACYYLNSLYHWPLRLSAPPLKKRGGVIKVLIFNDLNFLFKILSCTEFLLLKYFEPLLSVSRIDKISFDKLFIFDSSTIRLFSQVVKGVGRNPKGEGKKKKGGTQGTYAYRCSFPNTNICQN